MSFNRWWYHFFLATIHLDITKLFVISILQFIFMVCEVIPNIPSVSIIAPKLLISWWSSCFHTKIILLGRFGLASIISIYSIVDNARRDKCQLILSHEESVKLIYKPLIKLSTLTLNLKNVT